MNSPGLGHTWQECRPFVLTVDGTSVLAPEDLGRFDRAVALIWGGLTDTEKLNFHRFCCENNRDAKVIETINKISGLIQLEVAIQHSQQDTEGS